MGHLAPETPRPESAVTSIRSLCIGAVVLLALSACAGPRIAGPGAPQEREGNRQALMRLDANADGVISRAEAGDALRRELAVIDRDQDGRLSAEEIGFENDRRWRADGPAATPLIDWNQDGTLDFAEFANASLGLFDLADRDRNGSLSAEELAGVARGAPRQRPNPRVPASAGSFQP